MVDTVSKEVVKEASFIIDNDKAPAQMVFLQSSLNPLGLLLVMRYVRLFRLFSNEKLLKEINATIIALVTKLKTPQKNFLATTCYLGLLSDLLVTKPITWATYSFSPLPSSTLVYCNNNINVVGQVFVAAGQV